MPDHIAPISPTFAARKITQPNVTIAKVIAICSTAGSRPYGDVLPRRRSTISQKPCHAPHNKNVHCAPCHKPPSSIVAAKLT